LFGRSKRNFFTYEIFPRVGVKYDAEYLLKTLGNVFAIGYYRDEKLLHVYVKTIATENALRQYFDVKPSEFPTNFRYFAIAKLKRERDFYEIHKFNDIQSFLSVLEQGQGMLVWFALEPVLKELHYSRINKLQQLAQEGSEKPKQIIQLIRDKVKEPLYLVKLILLDNGRKRLKLTAKQLEAYSSLGLSWEIPFFGVKPNNITKIINTQPKLNYLYALLNEKKWIHVTRSNIDQLLIIPNPSVLPTGIGKGAPLPTIIPERHGFRVGVNPETGREVQLELEDLQRHMYVIGGTGAGKTSFLATLITRFMKTYPESVVVLIDPNGDFAEQLASEMADYEKLIYVDPVQVTIAVNPLSIPDGIPRDQAELLAESNIKEIFEQLFALKAGAVYVEYVIINALKILYMKSRSPTFADLYNIILKLRTGELDLPVSDPTWEEKLQQFQELEETTYISALSRLEEYATNPLLKKLFSSDSINDVLEPGNLIIINASNAQIGTKASFLMIAGWVYKLWYSALIRAALRKKRIPVLTVIDEFEVISDLSVLEIILSQARKFGMHLVFSHQHTDQVKNLLKSIFSNTAVKVLMRTAGDDAENLSGIDPAFSNEIKKILPKLEPGEAIMFMMPRKQGDPATPFKAKFDYTELKFDQEKLNTVIKRMREYYKVEEKKDDVMALVNPLFKYIEKPQVLEQLVLYHVFRNGKKMYLVDLLKELGLDRDKVNDVVNRLEKLGYINVEKEGNKKVLYYGKGLFGNVKAIAPSEEGRRLAMKVMLKYIKQGYYVAPAKQDQNLTSRPDLIAIPIDKASLRPIYDKAIAIEIESCNEISTHPEQVVRNWRKESVKDFAEVHSWTYEECFDKLQQLYNQLSDEEKNKVKIFSIKLKKEIEQKSEKEQKKVEETGEFTVQKPESKGSKQETISALAQGAPNNAQGTRLKLGSLTLKEVTIEILKEDTDYAIIKIGDKQYRVLKTDLELLEAAAKDPELLEDVKLKENKILIQAAGTKKTILLAPA
jgi:Cdc6-like AAA superfamily ATPase